MKAPLTLRRPANWQDFESLCKKLWGEIWNCPEIQKNGRLGQDQSGVDIFGIPFGEDGYYGIQSKGKSEYNDNHTQFTEAELLTEIEKAKGFQPPLKKLYFATTALNDSATQTFVRKKNLEHKKVGLFEVHLYCWEEIVSLIDDHKQTHDWYVKHQGYKSNQQVDVAFHDASKELSIHPRFVKMTTKYRDKSRPLSGIESIMETQRTLHRAFAFPTLSGTTVNESFCGFAIHVKNNGLDTIEDYKLLLEFEGEISALEDSNEEGGFSFRSVHAYYTNALHLDSKSVKAVPRNTVLVGDDSFITDEIFIKPLPTSYPIIVKWKLISRDFQDNGHLTINVEPHVTERSRIVKVENASYLKPDEVIIQDSIIEKPKED